MRGNAREQWIRGFNKDISDAEKVALERCYRSQRITRHNPDLAISCDSFARTRVSPRNAANMEEYWLNDEVINQYMILLAKREQSRFGDQTERRTTHYIQPLASNYFNEWRATGCIDSL